MKQYRIQNLQSGDTQLLQIIEDGKVTTETLNEFQFTGFSDGIHPYYQKQQKFILNMLTSAGVNFEIKTVPFQSNISPTADLDNGVFEPRDFVHLLKVGDKKDRLILIQDQEMGRGWAVLLTINADQEIEIITQEHRDTVLDELLAGDFIRSLGIDFKSEEVKKLTKSKP